MINLAMQVLGWVIKLKDLAAVDFIICPWMIFLANLAMFLAVIFLAIFLVVAEEDKPFDADKIYVQQ